MSQQVESINNLQLLVQMQLNGVIQQLERLERVADGVDRPTAMKRNKEGDRNHTTVEDNVAALKTKLMALNSTLRNADKSYSDACLWHLKQWYDAREGQYSKQMQEAISDSLDACTGKYQQTAASVQLNEAQLQEYSAKLALASQKFHEKEIQYSANPQAYLAKQQYQIHRYAPVNEEVLRSSLSTIRDPSATVSQGKTAKNDKPEQERDCCKCEIF